MTNHLYTQYKIFIQYVKNQKLNYIKYYMDIHVLEGIAKNYL